MACSFHKKFFLIAIFLLLFICTIGNSQTCSIQPENTSTAAKFGNGTPGSCTQVALQQLINTGGKIICNCGNDPYTLTLTATLLIPNKEVIIDGNNKTTISGNKMVRIYDKPAAASQATGTLFGLQNINLINGKAVYNANERGGAAILGRAFGSLKIVNVKFTGHESPLSASDDCGAVHTILYKDAIFSNCTFLNNKGANGGAIGTIGSATTIANCTFENNEATGTGGTFDKGGSGGAVYVDGVDLNGVKNTLNICNSIFKNNKAGYQAGALNVILYSGKGSTSSVDQCSFEGNSCAIDKGGAFYHMNGPLSMSKCFFTSNNTPTQGGALWISNTKLTLSNSTLYNNKAVSLDGKGGLGGAVCIDGSGTEKSAAIFNCTFSENQAGDFASAIFSQGVLSLYNNIFYKDKIGKDFQGNPYAGGIMNKDIALNAPGTNLQFPSTYSTIYETGRTDDWIASAIAKGGTVLTSDPLIALPADNGGASFTMALSANSIAINKGTNCLAVDQRGYNRTNQCDLGAYEFGGIITGMFSEAASLSSLNIFPNPANKESMISLDANFIYPVMVNIYDQKGQMVMAKQLLGRDQKMGISTLLPGLYLIRIYSDSKRLSQAVLMVE